MMYSVSTSYDYSTITVGVEAENEEQAIQVALELMADEWGQGVHDYSSIDMYEIN